MGYEVFNILDRQLQLHTRELINRMNRSDLVSDTTRIRLQQLQNNIWEPETILKAQIIQNIGRKRKKLNLTADILNLMATVNISLEYTFINQLIQIPYGGIINIKEFMGDMGWYNRNRKSMAKTGVMFLEQLLNATLTQAIPWQQIGGRAKVGAQPRWYTEVIEKFNGSEKNLYSEQMVNPFNTVLPIIHEDIQRHQMIVAKKNSEILLGLISRKPKERDKHSAVIQHYKQEIIEGIERSPLIPYTGCSYKDTVPLKGSKAPIPNKTQKCLITIDTNRSKTLPANKKLGSTTRKEDKRPKRRLLISPNSLKTYFDQATSPLQDKAKVACMVTETQKHLIITDENTRGRILDLQKALSFSKEINCYTDGSLSNNMGKESCVDGVKMGIGVVMEPVEHSGRPLDFNARIEGPASSTRPELWAILMALDLAPNFSRLQVFTDSASAIAAIKSYLLDKWGKKTKSLKNQDVLQAIKDKCNGKQIQFTLFKVTAHSGIVLNERADKLAKTGANKGALLRINPYFLQRNINYTWANNSLDINIKDFGKRERKVNWHVQWRTQYRVVKWCNKHISKDTDWKMTLKLIHGTKMSSGFTDDRDRKRRTFNLKILNDELPVMRNLHMRKPEVYKTDTCVICKQTKEDTLHPFECGQYNRILRDKIIEQIARIGKNQGSKFAKAEIVKNFRKENFMKIDVGRQLRGTIESDRFSFIDIHQELNINVLVRPKYTDL
ncbi:hypothetical protein Glove_42g82 [Diversispora epigaea]|uniref:ribonuclease H n=1 Tax=Diversispora epigaea TaxID=1348612 RepID=A0A397JF03_9GLOM|nr:hypothetical protein Glove_42g82 [Diversispora epigaea]